MGILKRARALFTKPELRKGDCQFYDNWNNEWQNSLQMTSWDDDLDHIAVRSETPVSTFMANDEQCFGKEAKTRGADKPGDTALKGAINVTDCRRQADR